MPVPANTVRVQILGHLGQNEVFATGFSGATSGVTSQTIAQASTNTIAGIVATAVTTLKAFLSPDGGYESIKAYWYSTAGAPATFITTAAVASGTGTGTNASMPLQTCVVATLQTAVPTRSTRGRMYLPTTNVASANHQLQSADCGVLATAVAAMLTAVNSSTALMICGVVSNTHGTDQLITGVKVDSRMDVQRRRAGRETVLFSNTHAV